jgi:hypothetical protein
LDLKSEASRRRGERAYVASLMQRGGPGPSQYFFAERPAYNRMAGNDELVYDDWLYPVFESKGLAKNRSEWLGGALWGGRARFVVTTFDPSRFYGSRMIKAPFLYREVGQFGPFWVYEITGIR